jgi:hypothetical protein
MWRRVGPLALASLAAIGLFLLTPGPASAAEGEAKPAEGGGKGEAAPLVGDPAPVWFDESAGLPAYIRERERDASRDYFEEGRRLYAKRDFAGALLAFRSAAEDRKARYATAAKAVDAILADKDSAKARDSLKALFRSLAKEDLIDADLATIEKRAGSSLRVEAELLRPRRISTRLADLLDAFLLVADRRPTATLDDSLKALRKACAELEDYPEAELWMGKVYLAEGEGRLAELQFQRAYTMRTSLEIGEERYALLEDLASIYRTERDMPAFEACLAEIVREDPLFSEKRSYLRTAMESMLGTSGFDVFLRLYRADPGPWTRAERELGEFYLESGRPQALIYLALSADAVITNSMKRIAERDPSWEYTDLSAFLDEVERDGELRDYVKGENLGKTLHEVGLALAAGGHREPARILWRQLAPRKELEPWNRSAARALGDSSGK